MVHPARAFLDAGLAGLACLASAEVAEAIKQLPAFDPWNLGAAGFVVWYAWYVTSKLIPRLVERFADELKAARDAHAAEIRLEREARDRDRAAFRCAHPPQCEE